MTHCWPAVLAAHHTGWGLFCGLSFFTGLSLWRPAEPAQLSAYRAAHLRVGHLSVCGTSMGMNSMSKTPTHINAGQRYLLYRALQVGSTVLVFRSGMHRGSLILTRTFDDQQFPFGQPGASLFACLFS